jgi:hypothetical protein
MILVIAIAIVYKLGIFNPILSPVSCNPLAGFSCSNIFLNTSGALNITITNSLGGQIIVNGIACASTQNSNGDRPQFGNVNVTGNSKFYPIGDNPSEIKMYSDTAQTFTLYCYNGNNPATGQINNMFYGYIWMNYTVPGYETTTQTIMSITSKYS